MLILRRACGHGCHTAVNIESQLKMSKIVGSKMIRQGHRGAIINISSHSGRFEELEG